MPAGAEPNVRGASRIESGWSLTSVAIETRQELTVGQSPPPRDDEPADLRSDGLPPHARSSPAAVTGRLLARRFKAFRPEWKRSLFQLITTATPFLALLGIMYALPSEHYWLALLLAIPAAGLLIRLFIIQHDCGHGAFFQSRAANDLVGRVLSVLSLTPYGHWRQGHAVHHATSGNLDRRGRGDVGMLTVAEYDALTPLKRLGYRLYRNPFIMVLLGAPINFIVLQRIPRGRSFRERDARYSILALDAALILVFGLMMMLIGVGPLLAIYLPVIVVASWIGNWLFFVQHQYEGTYWQRDGDWDFHTASLRGSSYFELPPVLRWFSGNIGLHHVHHLCSRVPNYHLQACVDSAPELARIAKRITWRESVGCWRLTLWDEQRQLMTGFRDARLRNAA